MNNQEKLERMYDKSYHYVDTASILSHLGRNPDFYLHLYAKSLGIIEAREMIQDSLVADGIESIVRGARECMVNETQETAGKYM